MPVYVYEISDEAGDIRRGTIEAESAEEAAAKLRDLGSFIISVEKSDKAAGALSKPLALPWGDKVKPRDLVMFNRQLATMVSSGLPLIDSVHVLSQQTESRKLSETLGKIEEDISAGVSFSGALAKFPDVFSTLYTSMVKAGETGGVLDEVLDRLAGFLEKDERMRREIKSATMYPKLLLGAMTGGVVFLITFVLPQFFTMFDEMGGELPLPTRMLMGMVNFMTGNKILIAILIGAAIVSFLIMRRTPRGSYYMDLLRMKIPVLGKLATKDVVSRCCRTLGLLYGCGVPLLEVLDTVKGVAGNQVIAAALAEVRQNVEGGSGIAGPLEQTGVFPPMVVYMTKVGEETGKLDQMLQKMADFYDEEMEATVKTLSSALEPLIMGVMALATGFIVMSIYFPMFDMMSTIKVG